MKKLLSLALSLLLILSAVLSVPSTALAATTKEADAMSETWTSILLTDFFAEANFTEKQGPSANFMAWYLSIKNELRIGKKVDNQYEKRRKGSVEIRVSWIYYQ